MGNFKELDRRLRHLSEVASQRHQQRFGLVLYEPLAEHYDSQEAYWTAVFAEQPAVFAQYTELKEAGRTIVLLPDNHRDDERTLT